MGVWSLRSLDAFKKAPLCPWGSGPIYVYNATNHMTAATVLGMCLPSAAYAFLLMP